MKPVLISISLLIVLSMSSFNSSADQMVKGLVTSKTDKRGLPGVRVSIKETRISVQTDSNGYYEIKVPEGKDILVFTFIGFLSREIKIGSENLINVELENSRQQLTEVIIKQANSGLTVKAVTSAGAGYPQAYNTEAYNAINENRFHDARQNPLSTFGVDVDAASYSNIRRFINNGQLPPADAVRIEEMINYFHYDYPQPENGEPVSINTEISAAPWNPMHRLVKIGLQGQTISNTTLPPSNLVFLIDVSGSMNSPDKLPLLKSSMRLLVDQLREQDMVSIVVYAGAAGQILNATSGENKQTIKNALDQLEAGGSTAGGAGINLAYKLAADNFIKGGNNRVILATDGDFNIGVSSDGDMQRLIEEKRKTGVFLTVLGFGTGNYKDSKMETLADKGNGNYAYIDNITEARKTLINEFGGTLFTIAKDVKLQVEFNPAKVQAYRLIGYENRLLNKEDFNNDDKDAGDMGSGHQVTALYEIIPQGVKSAFVEQVDELKYQTVPKVKAGAASELLTVKLRYKKPESNESKLISKAVKDQNTSWESAGTDFRFSAAVATYGMILRDSEFKQGANYDQVLQWAETALGTDREGYRAGFIKLVRTSGIMAKELLSVKEKMIMNTSKN